MNTNLVHLSMLLVLPAASFSLDVIAPGIEPILTPSEVGVLNDPRFQKYASDLLNSMPNATTANHPVNCGLLPPDRIVKFYLLNTDCKTYKELWIGDNDGLLDSNYDWSKELMVLFHGWSQTPLTQPFAFPLATARLYCELGYEYNLIVVDYSLAYDFWSAFIFACCGLMSVASKAAHFIMWVHGVGMSDPAVTQIAGFSLGGQVGPATAGKLLETCGVLIKRVTGN